MKIEFPDTGFEYIKTHLKRGLLDHQSFAASLEILYAVPEFARNDSDIHELVIQVLSTKSLGFRWKASAVLHAIGDPLGILHHTYNSLRIHPLLAFDHTDISGWHESVIRHADDLTEQCIDLLVDDMQGNSACFHGGTLAQLPAEIIVPRILPLLERGGETARYAAFVLATKGHFDDLPEILEKWLLSDIYPRRPLKALAYLRGNKALFLSKEYAAPSHPLYNGGKYRDANRQIILPFANYVQDVIGSEISLRTNRIMEKYFQKNIDHLMIFNPVNGRYDRRFQLRNPITLFYLGSPGVSATEFLSGHSSQQERDVYAAMQYEAVERLLQENELGYEELRSKGACQFMDHILLPDTGHRYPSVYGPTGMRIYFDQADYLFAATDWLRHPRRYLNFD